MKVILKETIESLGVIGSEVNVANGYARNYLLPQEKAVLSTPQNRKMMEQVKVKFEIQAAKEKAIAEQMGEQLKDVKVNLTAKVSEENRLYGSISARDIAEALAEKGIKIEKRMILMPEPIKETGTFSIPIRIYKDVEPEIIVEVVAES